jgi:hypothetical protein
MTSRDMTGSYPEDAGLRAAGQIRIYADRTEKD